MEDKTIMTQEHVKTILQEMANIIGEKQGVQITVSVKRKDWYKMKMEEKYIKRRTVATVLIGQAITLLYTTLFLYAIMH